MKTSKRVGSKLPTQHVFPPRRGHRRPEWSSAVAGKWSPECGESYPSLYKRLYNVAVDVNGHPTLDGE